ncbi:MAG: TonB-dependent receptor [Pseudomonadota bacterium]
MLTEITLLAALGAGQTATDEIEEVVVTASLREATAREVPASIAIIDAKTLQAAAQQHFAEVVDLVPNLNYSTATNRPRFFQIRGIGERSQYEGAPNPSVGFLVDDIDFSGIGTVGTLFDIDQVEVLRGPQGTRYGANALAGLVYIRSRDPSAETDARVEAMAGDYGQWSLGAAIGGALTEDERLLGRVAVQQYEADGFRDNVFLGRDDTDGRDELTGRLKLRWLATDDLVIDLTALTIDIDNGFDAFAPDNSFVMNTDDPGRDVQESTGLAARASYTGLEGAELVSLTTWADSDILYSFDGDWGNDDFWGEFAPYDFTSETDRTRETLSQEFRLVSTPGGEIFGGSTAWLVGLYWQSLEEDNRFLDFFNDEVFRDLTSSYEADRIAGFGQLDVALSSATTLTAGLRVERWSADYTDGNGLDLDPSETMVGGQLSIRHDLDDRRTVYATLARGFKAGGFNLGLSVPEDRREYDAEYLWNLEGGIRGRFLDNRLAASVSVFYSDRDDVQVGTSFQVDPTDPLTFVFFTDNAAGGSNYGVEAEADWQVSDRWRLFGALGLLETEFNDLETPERTLDGREQAHAPSYQFALGAEYRTFSGWFARADFTGTDAFFFSDSHDQRSESYELLNLRFGYETDSWAVYAWGRNVTDELYAQRGFFFGLEPPDFPDRLYVQPGDPRHYGVTAQWRW